MMRASELAAGKRAVAKATVSRGVFSGADKLDCDLKRFWFAFQAEAARLAIPLRVVYGWRSWEEQDKLYQRGTGSPPGHSAHNYGMAIDVIHTLRAWDEKLMPPEAWDILGRIGLEVARKLEGRMLDGKRIAWGGQWTDPWDPAHWYIEDWRQRRANGPEPCADVLCEGACMSAWSCYFPDEKKLQPPSKIQRP